MVGTEVVVEFDSVVGTEVVVELDSVVGAEVVVELFGIVGRNLGSISLALAPTSPQMLTAEMLKRTSRVQLGTATMPISHKRVRFPNGC